MELLRYVRSIKVVLILTTILLSPIKGLADGRKGEKIDRIEELSKKRSSSEPDNVIEHIENLDMSKKKEVSKTQSRDTVKLGNSNNSDNSKKIVRSASTESRNNLYSNKLLDCTIYVILALSIILLGICSYLLFVVNKLSKGRFSAEEKVLSALKEELSAKVNPQQKKGNVSENKNKERSSEEKGSLSAIEQKNWSDVQKNNKLLKEKIEELEKEVREKDTKICSLEEKIGKLESQLKAETAVESSQETKSPSSEANLDKVETQETTVYYIEGTPSTTEGIKLHTEKPNKGFFKVTIQGTSTSATLSVVEDKLDSILDKTSGFVSIEQGYGGPVAELISEGKGTIKYTGDKPEFTLTDKIKYKKV